MIDSEDIRKKGCVFRKDKYYERIKRYWYFWYVSSQKYGGLDFNTHAASQIVQKISSKMDSRCSYLQGHEVYLGPYLNF